MPHWLKVAGAVVGGLFALKLWNDSKALADTLKAKADGGQAGRVFIGGHTLPTPVSSVGTGGANTSSGPGLVTAESTNYDANPNTDYGRAYLDIAEGY